MSAELKTLVDEMHQECDKQAKSVAVKGLGYQEGVNLYLIGMIADLQMQVDQLRESLIKVDGN